MKTQFFWCRQLIFLALTIFLTIACRANTGGSPVTPQATKTHQPELVTPVQQDEDVATSSVNLTSSPEHTPTLQPISATTPSSPTVIPASTETATLAATMPLPLPLLIYSIDGHLYQAGIDDSPLRQITNESASIDDGLGSLFRRAPRVSPDGKWLALRGGWGGSALLNVADGGELGIGRGRAMRILTWSPDSQGLAYLSRDNKLCLYNLSGESDDCPFQAENGLLIAKWSPDGNYIAIAALDTAVSDECCFGKVWLLNMATFESEAIGNLTVTLEPGVEQLLTWLPDSNYLLIHSETNSLPDALYSLADKSSQLFDDPIISVAPNGRYFLHESGKISSREGDTTNNLPTIDDPLCQEENQPVTSWAWSPDSALLAFTKQCSSADESENSTHWLVVAEAAAGNKRWQKSMPANISLQAWTVDGATILLNNRTPLPENWTVWQIAANGMKEPEMIILQGLLINYVAVWSTPSLVP